MEQTPSTRQRIYRLERDGFTFSMDQANVERLRAMPDFEGREEPAVAEDFLRARAEGWAETLADAGAGPADIAVRIDPHQRKAHLLRATSIVVSADI
ncbi:MAG: hypothetical protein ABR576_05415 [Thermoanaerobaculia bacterium]